MKIIKQNNILLYLILSLFLTACKKDELPNVPEENNPVFRVQGNIGQENIEMFAGENDVFMQTDIDTFNNVKLSTGRIGNSHQSLSLSVFNSNLDRPSLVDDFMEVSGFPVANEFGGINLLSISPEDFENNQYLGDITWTVDGETQTTGNNLQINAPGKYRVCAEVKFMTGASEETCNTILVGYKRHADFQLKWKGVENNIIECFIASSQTVNEVKWYIDGAFVSDSLIYHYDGTKDQFHLKAEILFENGAAYEREVYINRFEDILSIGDWANKEQATNLKWDSNIILTFEKNGVSYKSIQNAVNDAKFTVDQMSNYDATTNADHEVKKIKGSLLVPFKNMTTGEVVDSDLKLEIGVGY